MKYIPLIMLALFIDGLQAVLSAALAFVAAIPGTAGGAVAGCLAGNAILGQWGCALGSFVLGLLGSTLDIAAPISEPIGLMFGFVISICISFSLGAFLIALLFIFGMYYPKYLLPGGIMEIIPGLDIAPGWTTMVILCILQKTKEEGGALGAVVSVATAVTNPSISNIANAAQSVDGIRAPGPQTNAA